ncbi:MAG: DUF2059 domain-containing protein [Pseudobdellovibrionaceae bacterium]|nr:DUF2059 domain-containing protein [Pseudobdellovibrionaceae bacterium]
MSPKFLLSLALVSTALAGGASLALAETDAPALENPVAVQATGDQDAVQDTMEERLALARELHDIRRVKERILKDIDAISRSVPALEREDFKIFIETNMDFDDLEQKSIRYAAETFTVAELKAMIAYFGSDIGKSAEAKSEAYGQRLGKDIQAQIDKALMAAKFDNVNSLPRTEAPQRGPSRDMLGN